MSGQVAEEKCDELGKYTISEVTNHLLPRRRKRGKKEEKVYLHRQLGLLSKTDVRPSAHTCVLPSLD